MTYSTVSQMFNQVTSENSSRDLYFYKKAGNWVGISGSEIRSTVKDIAFGLQSLGIGKGSNIALLSNNSPRWAMSDYGIICSGAATVSVYPTLISSQVEYILKDSISKVVFAENQEQMEKVMAVWENCPQLTHAVVMDDSNTETDNRIINFLDFLDSGTKYEQETETSFDDLTAKPEPNDLLTLIYTSGTTGNPKGVMLSHGNMMSNVEGIKQDISFDQTEIFLSFLPLSHSFERMGGHFTAFSVGAQVYYAESIETVPDNLREVKPSVVLSVPRLYEKMYAKVIRNAKFKLMYDCAKAIQKKGLIPYGPFLKGGLTCGRFVYKTVRSSQAAMISQLSIIIADVTLRIPIIKRLVMKYYYDYRI